MEPGVEGFDEHGGGNSVQPSCKRRKLSADGYAVSGFTPINSSPTAASSSPDIRQTQVLSGRVPLNSFSPRKRNPLVAAYLGVTDEAADITPKFNRTDDREQSSSTLTSGQHGGKSGRGGRAKGPTKKQTRKTTQRLISDELRATKLRTAVIGKHGLTTPIGQSSRDPATTTVSSTATIAGSDATVMLNPFRFQSSSSALGAMDGGSSSPFPISTSVVLNGLEAHHALPSSRTISQGEPGNITSDGTAFGLSSDFLDLPSSANHNTTHKDVQEAYTDHHRADIPPRDVRSQPNEGDSDHLDTLTPSEIAQMGDISEAASTAIPPSMSPDLLGCSDDITASEIAQMDTFFDYQGPQSSQTQQQPAFEFADDLTEADFAQFDDSLDLTEGSLNNEQGVSDDLDDGLSDSDLLTLREGSANDNPLFTNQPGTACPTPRSIKDWAPRVETIPTTSSMTIGRPAPTIQVSLDTQDSITAANFDAVVSNGTPEQSLELLVVGQADRRIEHYTESSVQSSASRKRNHAAKVDMKPIVRSPYPPQILDRSSIIGLSSLMLLRTCFRVGAALNAGCQAVRNRKEVVLELYAHVTQSWRESDTVKQHFVFSDLFHDHPPFLEGIYEAWKGVSLWEYDTGRFLIPSKRRKLCRCIGKMRRDGKTWKLEILNIWEATWEDIQWTKGIVGVKDELVEE